MPIDVSSLGKGGYTTIHEAVLANDLNATRAFLELGINPDVLDNHGLAPLHYSVMKNNLEITKLLLESEANVNIPSEPCTNPNCAEAMRCLLLDKATGNSEPIREPDVITEYFQNNRLEEDGPVVP